MLETSHHCDSNNRAPLLWVLCPLIAGYTLARFIHVEDGKFLIGAGLFLSVTTIATSAFRKYSNFRLWVISYLLAVICLSWSYCIYRRPIYPVQWENVPPRECILELKIKQIFDTKKQYNRISGIAEIVSAPDTVIDAHGYDVAFQVSTDEDIEVYRSMTIKCRGVISFQTNDLTGASELSGFDQYLKNINVHYKFRHGKILDTVDTGNTFYRLCTRLNYKFESILRLGTPADHDELANIYVAILLGKKSALGKEQKHLFISSGTMHFFAISGLHIGIIAIALFMAFRLIRAPTVISVGLGLSLLFLYVYVTGFRPSAIRAFTMIAFFWAGRALHRKSMPVAALSASALFILLFKPWDLWNPGFQLSYIVVLSILLYGLPLSKLLNGRFRPFQFIQVNDLSKLQNLYSYGMNNTITAGCISISAMLGSAPLVIYYFQIYSTGSIILNMILMPFVAIILITGLMSIAAGLIIPAVSYFINHAAWTTLLSLVYIVSPSQYIPGFFTNLTLRSAWLPAIYFIIFFGSTIYLTKETNYTIVRYLYAPVLLFAFIILGTKAIY